MANFPENTPLSEMTTEEQLAYWKHQARKHEQAYRDLGDVDELREMAEIGRNFDEDAIRSAAIAEVLEERMPDMVREAFRSRAKGIDSRFLEGYLEDMDVTQYVDDDLNVDVEAITERLESFGSQESHGGYRPHSGPTGVEAGMNMYKTDH